MSTFSIVVLTVMTFIAGILVGVLLEQLRSDPYDDDDDDYND